MGTNTFEAIVVPNFKVIVKVAHVFRRTRVVGWDGFAKIVDNSDINSVLLWNRLSVLFQAALKK